MKKIYFNLIMLVGLLGFAQTSPPTPLPPPTVGPGLPISDYLPLLFIAGLVLGVYFYKKYKLAS